MKIENLTDEDLEKLKIYARNPKSSNDLSNTKVQIILLSFIKIVKLIRALSISYL